MIAVVDGDGVEWVFATVVGEVCGVSVVDYFEGVGVVDDDRVIYDAVWDKLSDEIDEVCHCLCFVRLGV